MFILMLIYYQSIIFLNFIHGQLIRVDHFNDSIINRNFQCFKSPEK